jgi:hypothetical protein
VVLKYGITIQIIWAKGVGGNTIHKKVFLNRKEETASMMQFLPIFKT